MILFYFISVSTRMCYGWLFGCICFLKSSLNFNLKVISAMRHDVTLFVCDNDFALPDICSNNLFQPTFYKYMLLITQNTKFNLEPIHYAKVFFLVFFPFLDLQIQHAAEEPRVLCIIQDITSAKTVNERLTLNLPASTALSKLYEDVAHKAGYVNGTFELTWGNIPDMVRKFIHLHQRFSVSWIKSAVVHLIAMGQSHIFHLMFWFNSP